MLEQGQKRRCEVAMKDNVLRIINPWTTLLIQYHAGGPWWACTTELDEPRLLRADDLEKMPVIT